MIIADPRSLNQYLFIYGAELTASETFGLADRILSEESTSKLLRYPMTARDRKSVTY